MLLCLISLVILILDRLTKYWIQTNFDPWDTVALIPGVFHLTYVQNTGAAFGLLKDWTWLFILVTVMVITAVVFFYRYIKNKNRLFQLALALEVGGAVGNFIDRVYFGYVIDFLDFRVWPVFNIADIAIVIGAGILIYEFLGDMTETNIVLNDDIKSEK